MLTYSSWQSPRLLLLAVLSLFILAFLIKYLYNVADDYIRSISGAIQRSRRFYAREATQRDRSFNEDKFVAVTHCGKRDYVKTRSGH